MTFNHINGDEQLVLGSVTSQILANGAVTSSKLDIDANVDFNEFQALELRLENLSSTPSFGNPGRLIWNTTLSTVLVDTGSGFTPIGGGGSTPPGGADTSVQFNNSGIFGGDVSNFSWNDISNTLTVTNISIGSFALTTAPVAGYVLTSDAFGLGTWQPSTGGGLTAANFVVGETPAGLVNGINVVFTVVDTPLVGKFVLYVNGVRQKAGILSDYTISGSTITMTIAPETGSQLLADYIK